MIRLRDLERSYKTPAGQFWVLRRVNLEIKEGEFITSNPSGAGKSSSAQRAGSARRQLGRRILVPRFSGSRDETKRPRRARQAKHRDGISELSADRRSDREGKHRSSAFLQGHSSRAAGKHGGGHSRPLSNRRQKDLFPSQLSGGQQQLVGVARAVIHNPALLLADEPTGNLHSSQAQEIMELFRELNQQGTTIVQVTHSEANAAYGSRTIQVKDGWIVSDTAEPGLRRTRLQSKCSSGGPNSCWGILSL